MVANFNLQSSVLNNSSQETKDHVDALFKVCKKYILDVFTVESSTDNASLEVTVNGVIDKAVTYVANASAGASSNVSHRPVTGEININFAYFKYIPNDYANFESNFETRISGKTALDKFQTSYPNKVQNLPNPYSETGGVIYIQTPKVLEYAKSYFDDNTITKVPFENEGGAGSQGAHWERKMIQNEFMTASVISTDAVMSKFSLALLKDSNWYKDVKVDDFGEDSLQWGKGKKKEFYENITCKKADGSLYDEYFPGDMEVEDQCDFHHFGFGTATKPTFISQCKVISLYGNADCTKPENDDNAESYGKTFERKGINSKCFMSTINNTSFRSYKCYQYYCDSNQNLVIQFMQKGSDIEVGKLICNQSNQGQEINAPPGMSGKLKCPNSIATFCGLPVPCPNYCSGKGYCLRKYEGQQVKGTCHCVDKQGGYDCSKQCASGEYVLEHKNTCTAACPAGYTKNDYNRVCVLNQCHGNCKYTCTGPNEGDCTDCPQGKYFHNKQCVYSCPTDFYSIDGKTCKACTNNANSGKECIEMQTVRLQDNIPVVKYDGVEKNICPLFFSENDAHVICKSLGKATFKSYKIDATCSSSVQGYIISNVGCKGDEENLGKCYKIFTSLCESTKCVEVICDESLSPSALVESSLRLVSQDKALLVYHNNSFGGICFKNISQNEGNTICKQLGYDKFLTLDTTLCPEKSYIESLKCSQVQNKISECAVVYKDNTDCGPQQCLKITCQKEQKQQDPISNAKDVIKKIDIKLDGIYLVLAYLFGASIVFTIAICCVAGKVMSQGDYEVKIKVKKGDPTEVDAGDEEAEFNND